MNSASETVITKQDKKTKKVRFAVVRFCGDSGDGMQLTGVQFSNTAAIMGNDIMTFPDFPAEIRAPQGSTAGVSGFQVHFASEDIHTPGDKVDMLIAMNPAALKTNLRDLKNGGTLIVNASSFDTRNLNKAGYQTSPIEGEDGQILKNNYSLITAPISQLTLEGLKELTDLSRKDAERCKNFFALGLVYWLFGRNLDYSLDWIKKKFRTNQLLIQANQKALKTGYYFAETSELFSAQYEMGKTQLPAGLYRNMNGSTAIVLGLLTAAKKASLPLFYSGYPITPASDILHEISKTKTPNTKTFQAEDEIAAASAAIGAAYGGHIAITASSGPGIMLKSEAISLAVMTELPLVIINAQRGGPSTGLPTKTEQGDLLLALFGRSSESPIPVLAAATPGDCFYMIIEAVRLALKCMTPVFFMSDLYLIMGSEPWLIPDLENISSISHNLLSQGEKPDEPSFAAYKRDSQSLGRRWAVPGLAHFEHRIGGLEKDALTGNVSYDPENHELMVQTRNQKIAGIAQFIPEQDVFGDPSGGKLLILGWGSTYGAVREAVAKARQEKGLSVSHAHLRYINPLPSNLKELLSKYEKVLIPEMNLGQLSFYLQGRLGIQVEQMHKIKGKPFFVSEIYAKILQLS